MVSLISLDGKEKVIIHKWITKEYIYLGKYATNKNGWQLVRTHSKGSNDYDINYKDNGVLVFNKK
jgi:hypothetical protein